MKSTANSQSRLRRDQQPITPQARPTAGLKSFVEQVIPAPANLPIVQVTVILSQNSLKPTPDKRFRFRKSITIGRKSIAGERKSITMGQKSVTTLRQSITIDRKIMAGCQQSTATGQKTIATSQNNINAGQQPLAFVRKTIKPQF